MRWAAIALPVLLLAGCVEEAPAPLEADGQVRTARSADAGGVRTFDSSFNLVLNPDDPHLLAVNIVGGNPNCVVFTDGEAASYRLLGGEVRLEWDAVTPLAEDLVLMALGVTEPLRASGSSPLVLDLTGVDLHPEANGISFMADHEVPQVPVQQPADLQVTLVYEGELPTALPAWCTNGLL